MVEHEATPIRYRYLDMITAPHRRVRSQRLRRRGAVSVLASARASAASAFPGSPGETLESPEARLTPWISGSCTLSPRRPARYFLARREALSITATSGNDCAAAAAMGGSHPVAASAIPTRL